MSWGEAFGRAVRALLAIIAISVIGGLVLALGAAEVIESTLTSDDSGFLPGLALAIAGLLIIVLGLVAVLVKVVTDAIVDNYPRPPRGGFRSDPDRRE